MKEIDDKVWQSSEVVERYLDGIRGAVPFAEQQIEVMMRLVGSRSPVKNVLDLGCGNGILGAHILHRYPDIHLTLVDFSRPMLDAARESLEEGDNVEYLQADYGTPDWVDLLGSEKSFDVVVSGYSIHHQPDNRKKEVYNEIFQRLEPGGIFINMEHIAPSSKSCSEHFLNHLVDNLSAQEEGKKSPRNRDQLLDVMKNNEDSQANILAPIDTQCEWLTELGYTEVDCFFRVWELAVFGGLRPFDQ